MIPSLKGSSMDAPLMTRMTMTHTNYLTLSLKLTCLINHTVQTILTMRRSCKTIHKNHFVHLCPIYVNSFHLKFHSLPLCPETLPLHLTSSPKKKKRSVESKFMMTKVTTQMDSMIHPKTLLRTRMMKAPTMKMVAQNLYQ